MPLETIIAGVMIASLVLYALLGGADYGGGVWDLFAFGKRAPQQLNTDRSGDRPCVGSQSRLDHTRHRYPLHGVPTGVCRDRHSTPHPNHAVAYRNHFAWHCLTFRPTTFSATTYSAAGACCFRLRVLSRRFSSASYLAQSLRDRSASRRCSHDWFLQLVARAIPICGWVSCTCAVCISGRGLPDSRNARARFAGRLPPARTRRRCDRWHTGVDGFCIGWIRRPDRACWYQP